MGSPDERATGPSPHSLSPGIVRQYEGRMRREAKPKELLRPRWSTRRTQDAPASLKVAIHSLSSRQYDAINERSENAKAFFFAGQWPACGSSTLAQSSTLCHAEEALWLSVL